MLKNVNGCLLTHAFCHLVDGKSIKFCFATANFLGVAGVELRPLNHMLVNSQGSSDYVFQPFVF